MKLSKNSSRFLLGLLAFLLLSAGGLSQREAGRIVNYLQTSQPGLYTVLKVDDGDTITIDMGGQPERVRLIGVDTPELHHPEKPIQCYAKEAREFTTGFIGKQQVRLQADPLDDNRDLYGRLLRYVYTPDDELLNTTLIKEGYGFAYTHFPFTKKLEAIQLEATSKKERKGLWSACKIEVTDHGLQTNNL